MQSTPKPKLTDFKKITASRAQTINDNPPEPSGLIVKPAWVQGDAVQYWERMAPALAEQGVLTAWDADLFGMWCCLQAEFGQNPKMFPASKLGHLRLLAEMFGMLGPVSRERIKVKNDKKDGVKFFAA